MDQLSPLRPALTDTNPAHTAALAWLDAARAPLADITLRDGERLQFRRIEGPDTPFPDHAPLHWVAVTRASLAKRAWHAGDRAESLALTLANLAYARAFLQTQEGVVPMIKGSGVWQVALDGAYWLARQPLAPDEAAALQTDLAQDALLARHAIARGFRGEFTFFYKNVLERMPDTRDPDLLLGSLASLAMHPPQPVEEGERAIPRHSPPPPPPDAIPLTATPPFVPVPPTSVDTCVNSTASTDVSRAASPSSTPSNPSTNGAKPWAASTPTRPTKAPFCPPSSPKPTPSSFIPTTLWAVSS
ncbi:hypothetical protein Ga0100231_019310 [Opitutaceae bacterium TAV4]|nr:hypothetical protein Ga0100231_019310 [Opitutaceae bacterium TAV4]